MKMLFASVVASRASLGDEVDENILSMYSEM